MARLTMFHLAPRQEQVLDFILEVHVDGRTPTQQEIADEFDVRRQTASFHVRALVQKGWLTVRPGAHRTIEPTDRAWRRRLMQEEQREARAAVPIEVRRGTSARAAVTIRSVLRGLEPEQRQLVLTFASQ